jgi:hypothetical protein
MGNISWARITFLGGSESRGQALRDAEQEAAQLRKQAKLGLGRIVVLHYRSSTLYQMFQEIRCLYF